MKEYIDNFAKFDFIVNFEHSVWKASKYRVFTGPYFPVFGLNAEIYGVNLRIQSEYGKIRTRKKTPYSDTFHGVTDFTHCFGITIIKVDQVNVVDWNSCWSLKQIFVTFNWNNFKLNFLTFRNLNIFFIVGVFSFCKNVILELFF